MAAPPNSRSDIDNALAETERAGLLLTLNVRTILVLLLMVFIGGTQGLDTGYFGVAVCSIFLISGLIYRRLVQQQRDRDWMRYGFVALDVALLALVATVVPLSLHGDVPQIFVFRTYGINVFFFILATSALSLSPRLVLWTGFASAASIWAAWAWIVSGMERRVTWSDIVDDRTADKYIEIVLDPDHIGIADRVVETLLIAVTAAVTAAAVQRARTMLRRQISSERARAEVAEVFGRFVPQEVVDRLSTSSGQLPSISRDATVLFVDIAGFTRFAETADPEHIVKTLDSYFDAVSDVMTRYDGVVISLIGDAAMVAFNAPLENAAHAKSAVHAARDLLDRIRTETFAGQHFDIRIGIATGPVAAGTVGGKGRRSYTLYGDTVNLAQRLEAYNKETGTLLLVDESTWRAAGSPKSLEPSGECPVRGREAATSIYRLAGDAD
ncbi:MAG: adenylate/guanylate cyclase domain-containing protein [Pseudomonadota bacterium]